jgi:hypothetical protein
VLAILGTGVQARSHARAVPRVRAISEIRVAGRDPAKAASLADELAAQLGLSVRAVASYAQALQGADIACAGPLSISEGSASTRLGVLIPDQGVSLGRSWRTVGAGPGGPRRTPCLEPALPGAGGRRPPQELDRSRPKRAARRLKPDGRFPGGTRWARCAKGACARAGASHIWHRHRRPWT